MTSMFESPTMTFWAFACRLSHYSSFSTIWRQAVVTQTATIIDQGQQHEEFNLSPCLVTPSLSTPSISSSSHSYAFFPKVMAMFVLTADDLPLTQQLFSRTVIENTAGPAKPCAIAGKPAFPLFLNQISFNFLPAAT